MDSRRVEKGDRPRDEGVEISPIEKDKKREEDSSRKFSKQSSRILFATFLNCLKRTFDTVSGPNEWKNKVFDQHSIIEDLEKFQSLLIQLEQKDLSESTPFAIELSAAWIALLEHFDYLLILERSHLHVTPDFRRLIDRINKYPAEAEHHFGYYLIEHAGEKWIPFPFIEMLRELHNSYEKSKELSTTREWIGLIDLVIARLKSTLPLRPEKRKI